MLIFCMLVLIGCEGISVPQLPSLDQPHSTYKEDMQKSDELLKQTEKADNF